MARKRIAHPQATVYAIVNTTSGKAYIGQTKKPFCKRKAAHLTSLRKGNHPNKELQRDFTDVGEPFFMFHVLEYCDPADSRTLEAMWMVRYHTAHGIYNCARWSASVMRALKNLPQGIVMKMDALTDIENVVAESTHVARKFKHHTRRLIG